METKPWPPGLDEREVPDTASILGWIQEVFDRGVRRPGGVHAPDIFDKAAV